MYSEQLTGNEIAILGMDCRFPGANDIDQYWKNLVNGVESIVPIADDELEPMGVTLASSQLKQVNVVSSLDNIDKFDASFFGYSPKEASLIDPQHRIFLECAWSALESAGYCPNDSGHKVGVFAGCRMNTYLLNLLSNQPAVGPMTAFELASGSDSSCIATRVSHKLNLTGPAYSINTACSTGLSVLHLACQSLLVGECNMALSGAISIQVPNKAGYLYREGGISSPDGHCRAFDKNAQGTVLGNGVGIVVLKRYADAISDGDSVHAIIKATAVNNDGSDKANFTAPSVSGQISVISEALALSGVDAATIDYVEAHGTGTPIGDPIEIRALSKAFEKHTNKRQFCAIGSVKSNIGHLENAAGMAGLIKAVLALENQLIPPSINYSEPNEAIDFDASPFYVNDKLIPWKSSAGPRRAGVSSFGIGGTNVHVVLEQAVDAEEGLSSQKNNEDVDSVERRSQLLTLSAKSEHSLDMVGASLSSFLRCDTFSDMEDVAFTLQKGRAELDHRSFAVVGGDGVVHDSILDDLQRHKRKLTAGLNTSLVFVFPGQGSQYQAMARQLYMTEPQFARDVDHCLQLLDPQLSAKVKAALLDSIAGDGININQTELCQPCLFIVEYCLTKLIESLGLRADIMVGHSVGEYVAACIADVFDLKDALQLVSARARLMQSVDTGSMLSVQLSENKLRSILPDTLDIAVVNGKEQCVVSGPSPAIQEFKAQLITNSVVATILHTSHAFHSRMMETVHQQFLEVLEGINFRKPTQSFYSNLSGAEITHEQACSSDYWAQHMVSTVQFHQCIETIIQKNDQKRTLFLEVGPGDTLNKLLSYSLNNNGYASVYSCLPRANTKHAHSTTLYSAIGALWTEGIKVNWSLSDRDNPKRVFLPTYVFDKKRYWIDPLHSSKGNLAGFTAASNSTDSQDTVGSEALGSITDNNDIVRHPRPDLDNEYVPANTSEEVLIAEAWQDVLGIDKVGINDDFFDLGGHSLLVTMLVGRLKGIFDSDLSIEMFFDNPTIHGILEAKRNYELSKAEPTAHSNILDMLNAISDEEAEAEMARLDSIVSTEDNGLDVSKV